MSKIPLGQAVEPAERAEFRSAGFGYSRTERQKNLPEFVYKAILSSKPLKKHYKIKGFRFPILTSWEEGIAYKSPQIVEAMVSLFLYLNMYINAVGRGRLQLHDENP